MTMLGFVGLGLMGVAMAQRLLAAGHGLTVWNRSADKAAPVVAAGATLAASPADVTTAADIVFTCVTDAAAMEAVVFGPHGVARAEGAGRLLVDHSSIHPDATRDLAARLRALNGMAWVDAPVSGGVAGAEAGTLTVFAGGTEADVARVRPYLDAVAARVTRLGDVGAGQTAKLCNQMIVGCNLAAIAEALRLASRAGIDAAALVPAMAGGFADSKPLQIFGPRMLTDVTQPVTRLEIVLKDLTTALDVGARVGAAMPLSAAAADLYRALVEAGFGQAEFNALFRHG